MNKLDVTAIVLTFNEDKHIKRCLESIAGIFKRVVIVDSFSTDRTLEIAKDFDNVCVFQNEWVNYSNQFNWAIEHTSITTTWTMRIDADEFIDETLQLDLAEKLPNLSTDIIGLRVKRLMYFLGKPLKKAGMYPIWHIKIWRTAKGRCEQKWMDERIVLAAGKVTSLEGNLIDHNLNNITWWTTKHNGYATREAIDILDSIYNFSNANVASNNIKKQEKTRANFKHIYLRMPLFIRPFLFWFIRYFIQGGFLEGRNGFIWNFLQCLWYRFLVDVKIFEAYRSAGRDRSKLIEYFAKKYNLDVTLGGSK